MRILFFILLIPLFIRATAKDHNAIDWQAGRKLTWADFKGQAPRSTRDAALSNCGFGYSSNKVNKFEEARFEVSAQFYPDKSWVQRDKESIRLLQHEQRHFDLCELYARKLRKHFASRKWTGADLNDADKIYDHLFQELRKQQIKYDQETIHGLDTEKQNGWNEKIGKELKNLSDFATN